MSTLFGHPDSNTGLLFMIRNQLESNLNYINEDVISYNNLNLISTQLIFNLTLPTVESNPRCIDDKYKVKCLHLVMGVLRWCTQNTASLVQETIVAATSYTNTINKHFKSSTKQFFSTQEHQTNLTRILTKALQSFENLFLSAYKESIQIKETKSKGLGQLNWLQSNSNQYQPGDILAILKVFFYYLDRFKLT